MIILHIIVGLRKAGGAERMMVRLIEAQKSYKQCRHIVVSLTDNGELGVALENQGIKVFSLGASSLFAAPLVYIRLCKLIKKLKPDIVQTWMYHADLIGGLAARSVGIKNVVWNIRSTHINKGGNKSTLFIRRVCALLSYLVPKKIICVAEVSKKVHESIGYCSPKMLVVPNGFDTKVRVLTGKERADLRVELGLSASDIVIISVGRFNPDKDHKTFIEAAKLISDTRPNVKFLMIGRDITYSNKELSSLIVQSEYKNNFIFLGERRDVVTLLNISDIFCLHSITEGFPNVLGEAMLSKLPCVTTDVGDAGYLLNQRVWTIAHSNPDVLANKLIEMISMSPQERKNIGIQGYHRILQNFTIQNISDKYFHFYKKLMTQC